jgi:hypothetical protein
MYPSQFLMTRKLVRADTLQKKLSQSPCGGKEKQQSLDETVFRGENDQLLAHGLLGVI